MALFTDIVDSLEHVETELNLAAFSLQPDTMNCSTEYCSFYGIFNKASFDRTRPLLLKLLFSLQQPHEIKLSLLNSIF